MKGSLGLALALVLVAAPVAAQDDSDATATEAPTPPRARTEGDPPADELADVSSGPTLAQREQAARRGRPLDRRDYSPDPNDPDLPAIVQFALGGGSTIVSSSFDQVLHSHDYAPSAGFYLGDVTFLGRIFDWLEIGGRVGGRTRIFPRNDGPGGTAGVFDLQLIVQGRIQLGRVIDLGLHVGGGGAVVGVVLHDGAANGVAPRLTAGVHIGFRVGHGVRLMLRGSYDFCRWFAMDRFGDELELGGFSGAAMIEVRS